MTPKRSRETASVAVAVAVGVVAAVLMPIDSRAAEPAGGPAGGIVEAGADQERGPVGADPRLSGALDPAAGPGQHGSGG